MVTGTNSRGRLTWAKTLIVFFTCVLPLCGSEPLLKELNPPGAQRGKTFTLAFKGEGLESGAQVITSLPATFSRLAPPKELPIPDSELLYLVQLPETTPVGLYPVRVRTDGGLSNVAIFSVGDLPETMEKEPNNSIEQAQAISVPVIVNGNLTAADQDFFRLSVKAHERLVIEVEARRMSSAIDPAIEVFDSAGRRVAFDDDAPGLGVDARVDVTFPKAGTYYVLVHDSKYSDQERNFYRLKIGSFAYADAVFPLGGQRGKSIDVSFIGGNLESPIKVHANLDVPPQLHAVSLNLPGPKPIGSLPFQLQVSDLPEEMAPEGGSVVELKPSTVMNGRIAKPGQVDRYKIIVSPGQQWLLRLEGASLGTSRLYGELTIYDSHGKKLPAEDVGQGPDPVLAFRVPEKVQEITLAVQDLRNLGGPAFGYRLLAMPKPGDFSLKLMTPYVNVPGNGTAKIEVVVERYGYDGPVHVNIPNLPEDVTLQGGNIPAASVDYAGAHQKETRGLLTITAKPGAKPRAFILSAWGEATLGGELVRHRAEGPGLVLSPNEEPIFDAQNNAMSMKPLTAPWLGMELPASIRDAPPAILQVATQGFPLAVGMSHPIEWKLLRQGSGIEPGKIQATLQYGEVRGLELEGTSDGGVKDSLGKEEGKIVLRSQPDSPLVKFDMVLIATIKENGKEETIVSPALTVDLVRGYTIKLGTDRVELKGGGKVELAGTLEREPSFGAPVKIKVFDPPDKVTCLPIEVPVGTSEFRLACEAAPDAQGGDFEAHLVSSATIPGRRDNREYSFPPLSAHLVVAGEKTSSTAATRKQP